ncbi:bifunctional DedA family/phosphatase PAP2 family protein [Candidatus Peregrinibacteria bacterium]|nr:bifunctional DedA family/phosphatase PAP2 family protein [Candidatus Peregrinibacteria bacterium]
MHKIEKILSAILPVLDQWGYVGIGVISLLEATPLVGFIVPGQTIVIISGFLAQNDIFNIWYLMIAASAGAIGGDLIGYILGKKYGHPFIVKYGKYFYLKEENYKKTKDLMTNHVGKALIVGRFTAFTRALAPFIAGIVEVPFIKFIWYNIIGGIAWSVSFVLIGYIFGASYKIVAKSLGVITTTVIVATILLMWLYKVINKKKHIFKKKHIIALIVNVFSLYIFGKMIEDVMRHQLITRFDVWVSEHIMNIWQPLLNKIMIVITGIGSPETVSVFFVAVMIFLLIKRKKYESIFLFSTFSFGMISGFLVKYIVGRFRPAIGLISETGHSLPSGHALGTTLFFMLFMYLFRNCVKNKILKTLFIIGNILMILIISFSRIYLNVHWVSDIIAGISLGIFWFTLAFLSFESVKAFSNAKEINK